MADDNNDDEDDDDEWTAVTLRGTHTYTRKKEQKRRKREKFPFALKQNKTFMLCLVGACCLALFA